MKRRKVEQPEEEFQMAPMIDMVFLLLVFFMTVSTLARDERVELDLPESERSAVPEDLGSRGTVSIGFNAEGGSVLYVGAQPVSLENMQRRVREAVAADPGIEIYVRAEREMPFREIRRVLEACAEAGAFNVIYGTYQAF